MLTGEVQDGLVERCEYKSFAYRQAEQVGVGDLIVSVETFGEGLGQGLPVGIDGLVVVAGLLNEARQETRRLFDWEIEAFQTGQQAENASLGEGTKRPPKTRRFKPCRGCRVMDVGLIQQGECEVDVEEVD